MSDRFNVGPEDTSGKIAKSENNRLAGVVPELRLWPIQLSIALAILGGAASVAVFVWIAFWLAGFPDVERDGTVSSGTVFDLLKLAFAVVAGVGGIVALIVAYRRQRVVESANKIAEINASLAHLADQRAEVSKLLAEAADRRASVENDRSGIRLLNERFTKAAEQLGSDHPAIRLAGAYSMASLADDWEEERQTCIDVICGYLRMAPGNISNDDEVRRTLTRIIVSRVKIGARPSWQGYRFDLAGSMINEWDFRRIAVGPATLLNLEGADFSAAAATPSFRHLTVTGGVLRLSRVVFGNGIDLSGLSLAQGEVDLQGSKFVNHNFSLGSGRVKDGLFNLRGCEFHSFVSFGGFPWDGLKIENGLIDFTFAKFKGGDERTRSSSFSFNVEGGTIKFVNTTFSGCGLSFHKSRFAGGSVDFEFADLGDGVADFSESLFDGGAVDFSKPHKWGCPPRIPEGGSPWGLELPSPEWRFEEEPPF